MNQNTQGDATSKFENFPVNHGQHIEKAVIDQKVDQIHGYDVLIQEWHSARFKGMSAVFLAADISQFSDSEISEMLRSSSPAPHVSEELICLGGYEVSPCFYCVDFSSEEEQESSTDDSAPARSARRVPADQISLVLYEHDPMNTCCSVNDGMEDEYDTIASHIADLIAKGSPVDDALREALIFWFHTILLQNRDLNAITRDLQTVVRDDHTFRPFVYVETESQHPQERFKVVSLFAEERFWPLDMEFFNLSDAEQDEKIKSMIRANKRVTYQKLKELGDVRGYSLYCPKGYPVLYDLDGNLDLEAMQDTPHGRSKKRIDYKEKIAVADSAALELTLGKLSDKYR